MNLFWKRLTRPITNETKQVDAVQLWTVRWTSQRGKYPFNQTRPEMEAFVSEFEANKFADALRNAFQLTRHTTYSGVSVGTN